MSFISNISRTIQRALTQPRNEMTRAQRSLRYAVDLARYSTRTMQRDRAPQMAAALTYRTIFSLVPVVALSLVVFRAFVGAEDAGNTIRDQVYSFLNIDAFERPDVVREDALREDERNLIEEKANDEAGGADDPPAGEKDSSATDAQGSLRRDVADEDSNILDNRPSSTQEAENLRDTADTYINKFIENAYALRAESLGGIGIVLLIWAALALIVTVEQSFNTIYRAPSGRAWHHRIMLYWGILTLGPVLMVASFFLAKALTNRAAEMSGLGPVFSFLGGFTGLFITWLLFFLLYALMPNARVRLQSATIGAIVAALLWELAQFGYGLYVENAVGFQNLYGNLALIPLSLFWLYLTWLIILFGLEISYATQTVANFRNQEEQEARERDLIGDPMWFIPVITCIGNTFRRGESIERQTLADTLGLSIRVIDRISMKLEEARYINHVQPTHAHQDAGYALAVPPDQIRIADVLALARSYSGLKLAHESRQAKHVLKALALAEDKAAGDLTLAALLHEDADATP